MITTLFTVGFTQKTAEQFFGLLEEAKVQKVVDIRENRAGQLSGFAKHPDIAFFLDRLLKIEYSYEPRLAPTPEIRQAYRTTRDWQGYEASFLELMRQRHMPQELDLDRFDSGVALLCSEPGPEKCHRRLVAEMLARHASGLGRQFEVRHLVIATRGKCRPRKALHAGADSV